MDLAEADVDDFLFAIGMVIDPVLGPDFGEFPMEMDHMRGARPLVEVVHVLGDDVDAVVLFQGGDGEMGGIRTGIPQLGAALVVEVQYQGPVPVPALDGRDIVDVILFP